MFDTPPRDLTDDGYPPVTTVLYGLQSAFQAGRRNRNKYPQIPRRFVDEFVKGYIDPESQDNGEEALFSLPLPRGSIAAIALQDPPPFESNNVTVHFVVNYPPVFDRGEEIEFVAACKPGVTN
jgi:hypothetical protein